MFRQTRQTRQTQQTWKQLVFALILALALVGCNGTQPAQNPSVDPAQVTAAVDALPEQLPPQTVETLRQREDVVILDVREDWEYAEGHIPGATLIPLGQLPQRISEVPKDKTVIAVCRSGNRSGQATDFLRQQGFDNVHNMQGGMLAWEQVNYEIER